MRNIRQEAAIWIQIAVSIAIWICLQMIFIGRVSIDWESVKLIPEVVTVYTILHILFTTGGWRLPFLQGWLVPFPDLQGTWQGTLQTTWERPDTKTVPPPIPCILVIKQSFDTISCSMYTKESASRSNAALLAVEDESGIRQLSYNYTNIPMLTARHQSPVHDGAAVLRVITTPGRSLQGEYWTNRKTTGEVILIFRSKHLLESFPENMVSNATH